MGFARTDASLSPTPSRAQVRPAGALRTGAKGGGLDKPLSARFAPLRCPAPAGADRAPAGCPQRLSNSMVIDCSLRNRIPAGRRISRDRKDGVLRPLWIAPASTSRIEPTELP